LENEQVLDVIGVGIGPFNLGLAALLDQTKCKSLFFDLKSQFDWHPGMLLEGTTLQVPFLADLVTMVDPTSPYTYLNYLHEHRRLYHFYFYEKFHIPRTEYNHYCQWVAGQLPTLQFGAEVENIEQSANGRYVVTVFEREQNRRSTYEANHIVLGVGTKPYVPADFRPILGERIFHSGDYLNRKEEVLNAGSVTVIGSGQSAAEIFYDLLKGQQEQGYELSWFTRSKGFYPMEYSKLGLEHFSPDYTRYFYQLPKEKKKAVLQKQDLLYKGISFQTIADIYDLLYERTVGGVKPKVHLQALTELVSLEAAGGAFDLLLHQTEQDKEKQVKSEVVILATGYRPAIPSCLDGIRDQLIWDEEGQLVVEEHYRVKQQKEGEHHLFVQNGELHTHGVGAPDLGLGAQRNAAIVNQLIGEERYRTPAYNVFQQFGL
jgi:lysine N6-hydroxylase